MNTKNLYLLGLLVLVWVGCIPQGDTSEAKKMADKLLDDIANGTAHVSFPQEYFPPEQTTMLMDELKNRCDFPNREGRFINDFRKRTPQGDQVAFIYEFYLKCDSLRMILVYEFEPSIRIRELGLEPLEKENPMILQPERQLVY